MSELLSAESITSKLTEVPGWTRSGDALTATWTFKGFNGATQAANVVAFIANKINHHPDIAVHDYNRLTITVTSHDAGGITENDFKLAGRVNALLNE
jgi:4a-hydroxytetrahydrobiopterin dehydratase